MYLSPAINALIEGPWGSIGDLNAQEWEDRCYGLRNDLDNFTDGSFIITATDKLHSKKECYLKRLKPRDDEIWEIRCCEPLPQLRVFGRFAQKDVFVGLTWALRPELLDHLTFEGTQAWRRAMVECATEWRRLFPSYPALSGASIHDHVSNAFPV